MIPARAAVVLLTALVLVAMAATPSLAHTRASSATNLDSRIEQVPALPGVTWRVYPGGEYLEVTNRGRSELIVLGYSGEPYLRVGPDGVQRNRNSPATYLNAERFGDVAVPPRADADAPPEWERLTDEPRYAWHDHRIHWMAPDPPGVATDAPPAGLEVFAWAVPVVYDGERLAVRGRLMWVPSSPWWAWLGLGLALTAGALAGLRRRDRLAIARPAAVVVAAVALFNLVHLPDEVAALPLPALDVVFGVLHNVLFIGTGLVGAGLAWRKANSSLLPLGIASGAVLFHQGLLQIPQLAASQLATVWPAEVIRIAVALSVGQAAWVALVVGVGLHLRPPAAEPEAAAGTIVPAAEGPSPLVDA
jgi:hypothetical protein